MNEQNEDNTIKACLKDLKLIKSRVNLVNLIFLLNKMIRFENNIFIYCFELNKMNQ